MKKLIFLGLIIFVTTGSYAQQNRSPLVGTWRCVAMGPEKMSDGSFPAMIKLGTIKTFSNEYFTFVGHFATDTVSPDTYGGGTYTLNGNKYEEHIMFHNVKTLINMRFRAIDEIRHDTLYHSYNNDVNGWDLGKNYYTEKYVRLK